MEKSLESSTPVVSLISSSLSTERLITPSEGVKGKPRPKAKVVLSSTKTKDEEIEVLNERKGLFSWYCILGPTRLIFVWLWKFSIKLFFMRSARLKDIPRLPEEYRCEHYENRFRNWFRRFDRKMFRKVRLFLTLYACFGLEFLFSGVLRMIGAGVSACSPLFLQQMLLCFAPEFTADKQAELEFASRVLPPSLAPDLSSIKLLGFRENDGEVWLWLLGLVGFTFLSFLLQQYSYYVAFLVANKMRLVLQNVVYGKLLSVDNEGRKKYSNGKIMNYFATDVFVVEQGHLFIWDSFGSIILLVLSVYFLVQLLGTSAIFTCLTAGAIIVGVIICVCFIFYFKSRYFSLMDKRISWMKAAFLNMLEVKSFQWERIFLGKILNIRAKEITVLRLSYIANTIVNMLGIMTPPFLASVSFCHYYFVNSKMNYVSLLTSLSYFTLLRVPITSFAQNMIFYCTSLVSIGRIQGFLNQKDGQKLSAIQNLKRDEASPSVSIKNGWFSWKEFDEDATQSESVELKEKETSVLDIKGHVLEDINLEIENGSLVVIVGDNGSSKTSLCLSMINELYRTKTSEIKINGTISYASQQPFLIASTVKKNITFFEDYDESKLKKILSITSLEKDLDSFEGGINQGCGEEGSTFSSGQKQRVALARCLYKNADIYILDSILNQLDHHVSASIYQKCILEFLKGKTRILVTTKLHCCSEADLVIVMEKGKIVQQGKFEDLMESKGKFSNLMEKFVKTKISSENNVETVFKKVQEGRKEEEVKEQSILKKEKKVMLQDEERYVGFIPFDAIKNYIRASGGCICTTFIISAYFLLIIITFGSEFHISNFTTGDLYHNIWGSFSETNFYQNMTGNGNLTEKFWYDAEAFGGLCPYVNSTCGSTFVEISWDINFNNGTLMEAGLDSFTSLMIYVGVILFVALVMLIASQVFYNLFLTTSKKMFQSSVSSLFRAKMSFFFRNPIGRIISRLAYDSSKLEQEVPQTMENALITLLVVITAALVACGFTLGVLLVPYVFAIIVIVLFYLFVRKNALELKRIESISRSPQFHHFMQSIKGRHSIKAFALEEKFKEKAVKKINKHNRSFWFYQTFLRMAEEYFNFIGVGIVVLICSACIVVGYYIPIAEIWMIGLAVTFVMMIPDLLGVALIQMVMVETNLNFVERLNYYSDEVPKEEHDAQKRDLLELKGEIQLKDVSLRYDIDLPYVLKDWNISIKAKEKIGVVGRTGAGKSTLALLLLRFIEPESGEVLIDGKSTKEIPFSELRSQVTLIPAHPVLFQGTIRSNLDENGLIEDEKMMQMIDKCKSGAFIQREGGLDGIVEENGKNFSEGERQLISLMRSLLRPNTKIFLIDEFSSTLNEDIVELFKGIIAELDVTVLCISHNLKNVISFDRILLIEAGKAAEFDTPKALLSKKDSLFSTLVALSPSKDELYRRVGVTLETEQTIVSEESEGQKEQEVLETGPVSTSKEVETVDDVTDETMKEEKKIVIGEEITVTETSEKE